MHPWDHARSSARLHGGEPEAYLEYHAWFDQTKIAAARPGHRLFRHHHEGIQEAVSLFGCQIPSSSGDPIDTTVLGRQHVEEDCAKVPYATDWLSHIPMEYIEDRLVTLDMLRIKELLPVKMASRFGGHPGDYQPIHDWFFQTESWHNDLRHLVIRHNSFGIFACEDVFGLVFTRQDGVKIPIRLIAEHHVRTVLKAIPSAYEVIRTLKLKPWMNAATSPQRMKL
jgi:hypothetical protein